MTDLNNKIRSLPISWAGRFIYSVLPYRRKVIEANIDQVFADKLDIIEKKRLVKAYYSHLYHSACEAFRLRFMTETQLCNLVEVRGHESIKKIIAQQKGVLVLTGHFGNWEVAPIGGVLNFKELRGKFHFIRRTLGFKKLERILFKRYYQAGLNVIPKKNSLDQVCAALEKNHVVVFVLDQHASLKNRDGIAVEFFGKKAGTYRSLAMLSRYTDVPVVPAASYRLPDGKHVLEFFEPIPWLEHGATQESLYQNTLLYNQALERIILAHPEQWNWMHKRWKLKA